MFVQVPVQVRRRHLSEVKGLAANVGLSVVTFGTMKEGSKSVTVAVQGSDKKAPGFVKVLIDNNVARELSDGDPVTAISPEAKTA